MKQNRAKILKFVKSRTELTVSSMNNVSNIKLARIKDQMHKNEKISELDLHQSFPKQQDLPNQPRIELNTLQIEN